jgi:hypothetical protein
MLSVPSALLLALFSAPAGPIAGAVDVTDPSYVPLAEAPDGMGDAVGLAPPGIGAHVPGISLFGAEALPRGHLGLFGGAGFPYLTAEALYGLSRRWGVYARFDSLYSVMEQVTLGAKWTVAQTPHGDALALRFEANQSFFEFSEAQDQDTSNLSAPPDDKAFSARWLTGQRNEGAQASLVLSTRYASGMTLFFDGGVDATVDTEPLAGGPLSGNPPLFTLGFNAPLHVGLEVPVGRRFNFVVTLGADLHFRRLTESQDSIAIPFFSLGADGLL